MIDIKLIKNNIKKIPKPIIASVMYMIIVFFQSGVNLLTTPIFSRILTVNDYGITTTYTSWYSILSIFVTLNLYAGVYNNALIDYKEKKKEITSSFLSITIVLSVLFYGIYIIFRTQICNITGMNNILMNYMFLNFLSLPAWNFFLTSEKFDYKYKKPLVLCFITFILNPIIGIIGIKIFPNNMATAKIVFSGLPSLLLNIILLFNILLKGKCFFKREYWSYALKFNIPLIPHYLSNVVLSQSDRIMIAKMVSNEAAGIYGVAYYLSNVISGIFTGINAAWIPYTYKSLEKQDYKGINRNTNLLLLFIMICVLLVVIFSPEIMRILATDEYRDAIWIIPPVVLGLFFNFVSYLFVNIEMFYKKNIFVTIATCLAAIINIILNFIFIPKYGFVVAGYTTLASYIIFAVMHYCTLRKITKDKIYNLKVILLISMVLIILTFIFMFLYAYFVLRLIIVATVFAIILVNFKKITPFILEIAKKEN